MFGNRLSSPLGAVVFFLFPGQGLLIGCGDLYLLISYLDVTCRLASGKKTTEKELFVDGYCFNIGFDYRWRGLASLFPPPAVPSSTRPGWLRVVRVVGPWAVEVALMQPLDPERQPRPHIPQFGQGPRGGLVGGGARVTPTIRGGGGGGWEYPLPPSALFITKLSRKKGPWGKGWGGGVCRTLPLVSGKGVVGGTPLPPFYSFFLLPI